MSIVFTVYVNDISKTATATNYRYTYYYTYFEPSVCDLNNFK